MAVINIPKYFSQQDGDASDKGDCVETCLKMMDCYLTGREIAVHDIVLNGDGIGGSTSIIGAQKAAQWLGFGLDYFYAVTAADITKWLKAGRLLIAFINYGKLPALYKQDTFTGCHAVLVTGIDEGNNSIRYADPDFWSPRREDGWMNNNKWASWQDFTSAWFSTSPTMCENGTSLVCTKVLPPPAPPVDPLTECNTKVQQLSVTISEKNAANEKLTKENADLTLALTNSEEARKNEALQATQKQQTLIDTIDTLAKSKQSLEGIVASQKKELTDAGEKISSQNDTINELEKKVTGYTEIKNERDTLQIENQDLNIKLEDCLSHNILENYSGWQLIFAGIRKLRGIKK